jgi:hypothetical protein
MMRILCTALRRGGRLMTHRISLLATILLAFPLLFGTMDSGLCAENSPPIQDFDSIMALVELLKAKGVLSDEEVNAYIEQYKEKQRVQAGKGKVITIIPEDHEKEKYMAQITEEVSRQLQDDVKGVRTELRQMSDELLRRSRLAEYHREEIEQKITEDLQNQLQKSGWAQRIRWGGDIRLRYQGDRFDEDNADLLDPSDPSELMNTKTDRDRGRVRVRLAAKADIFGKTEVNIGKVVAGARITTGNEDDPVSTNETLGDYYNRDTVVLDRAYLQWKYTPTLPIWDKYPEIKLVAGRFANPFYSTDLVWDSDISFEGAALSFKTDTLMSNPWKGFLNVGAFPLQEEDLTEKDKWLYAGQVGVQYDKTMGLSWKLGLALYAYRNTVGTPNDSSLPDYYDWTAPEYQQMGNTLIDIDPSTDITTALASEYKLLNLTTTLDYDYWYPIHIMLMADFVKNIGFDRDEVAQRTGNEDVQEEDKGYQVKMLVGHPEFLAFGDWNVSLAYKHLESDATIDAFTDSDFHLGGTNAEGWVLGGGYGLWNNLWLYGRWISSNEIEGPALAVDTFQLDLNARF